MLFVFLNESQYLRHVFFVCRTNRWLLYRTTTGSFSHEIYSFVMSDFTNSLKITLSPTSFLKFFLILDELPLSAVLFLNVFKVFPYLFECSNN